MFKSIWGGVLSRDNDERSNKRVENNILTLGLRSTKILFIYNIDIAVSCLLKNKNYKTFNL